MQKFKKFITNNNQLFALGVVTFFLICGVILYAIGWEFVLKLTPIVIASIAALMIIFWDNNPKTKIYLVLAVMAIGTIAEYIGVHTGFIFGEYKYSSVIGFLIWGVPFIIGLLWFIVSLSAWQIANLGKTSTINKILLASGLMVMLDLVLEQFATSYNLWTWKNGLVPILNYVTWFVLALIITSIFSKFDKSKKISIFNASILPILALYFWLMLIVR